MQRVIKSYSEFGEHCGIAKQVEGQTVDAERDEHGQWHFEIDGVKWIASDYAFIGVK